MKKRILLGVGILAIFFAIIFLIYSFNLRGLNIDQEITFKINSGESTTQIINDLKDSDLIRNKFFTKFYMYINNKTNLKAGDYILNKNMSTATIVNKLYNGDAIDDSLTITFLEGKRLTNYVDQIANNFDYSKEEIMTKLSDKAYLKSLIDKYWFIDDEILNSKLYNSLEGYLYPDTYTFKADSSIDDIIAKMLDNMSQKINDYQEAIKNSNHTYHELLTLASIVELEAASSDDRLNVAGVFYNRLNSGWTLGSDVTTYYGAQKNLTDELSQSECLECNAYNTRSTCLIGLPVGPIDSPSIDAIKAVINPNKNDYYFFVADINKKVYFSQTSEEQAKVIATLKSENMWYNY